MGGVVLTHPVGRTPVELNQPAHRTNHPIAATGFPKARSAEGPGLTK